MRPDPAVFSRARPCTKREIWTCFASARGFRRVQVDQAHAVIGLNVPRVLERNSYVIVERGPRGDFYRLTEAGEDWLTRGICAYVRNHPAEAAEIEHLPPEALAPARRR